MGETKSDDQFIDAIGNWASGILIALLFAVFAYGYLTHLFG